MAKFHFTILLGVCLLVLGLVGGWLLARFTQERIVINPVRQSENGYSLIDPMLYIQQPEDLSFPTYSPLKNALQQYVSAAEQNGTADAIGIYYRDLNSGDWIGINPTQDFDPASMMKVATLIALLRVSEERPDVLSTSISIPASVSIPSTGMQDYYPPSDPVKSGNTYTVPDLMQRLIEESDNGADAVLINYLGAPAMATVYDDLHLPQPGTSSGISVQDYSHLFRTLYNATYLNSADSEEALHLLSQTDFTAGLVAGVPASTTVAHKFGESRDSGVPGLNDCGIIYYPDNPYFLCVMTTGTSFDTLASVIKNISAITWQQVGILAKTN